MIWITQHFFECHQDVWILKKAMSMKMAILGLQNCVQKLTVTISIFRIMEFTSHLVTFYADLHSNKILGPYFLQQELG